MTLALFLGVTAITAAVDQAVKWGVRRLSPAAPSSRSDAKTPLVAVGPTQNPRGGLAELSMPVGAIGLAALGLLSGFLILVASYPVALSVALGLAAGGAAGNWLDSGLRGEVTDYIRFRSGLTVNFADIAIAAGSSAALVVLVMDA